MSSDDSVLAIASQDSNIYLFKKTQDLYEFTNQAISCGQSSQVADLSSDGKWLYAGCESSKDLLYREINQTSGF